MKQNVKKVFKKSATLMALVRRFHSLLLQLNRIINAVGPSKRLRIHRKLKQVNYVVDFVHEGSIQVRLPEPPVLDIILGRGVAVERNFTYQTRPFAEVLLRKTVYELYETGFIDRELSIVDIGSWISDNSAVWAQYLNGSAEVIAIDPSPGNIAYGQEIARINNLGNIKFVQAVCAESSGIKLDWDGYSIDHASFKVSDFKRKYMLSDTIDEIIVRNGSSVGFLHVDVEGLELQVLKGSLVMIARDLPVIAFEQHISSENVGEVTTLLGDLNYRVFMVNEVLPDCNLDCRNFLAFPPDKGLPQLTHFEQQNGNRIGIVSATIGDILLEIQPTIYSSKWLAE